MFQGKCEEAINFYVAEIPGSAILDIQRAGPEGPGTEGSLQRARISLCGQTVLCFDSPVQHAFTFTPAFSFFVECESEAEIKRLSALFAKGGDGLMPLGEYGFSRKFAWVSDRYGVSWQFNLA